MKVPFFCKAKLAVGRAGKNYVFWKKLFFRFTVQIRLNTKFRCRKNILYTPLLSHIVFYKS